MKRRVQFPQKKKHLERVDIGEQNILIKNEEGSNLYLIVFHMSYFYF